MNWRGRFSHPIPKPFCARGSRALLPLATNRIDWQKHRTQKDRRFIFLRSIFLPNRGTCRTGPTLRRCYVACLAACLESERRRASGRCYAPYPRLAPCGSRVRC
jgi:hypothetical protein